MEENIRIAFLGPPHSGKSVLFNYIYSHLNQFVTAKVCTAPDGEGTYSLNENDETLQNLKIKGRHTEELTSNNVENIKNQKDAGVVLVDAGGKFSKDNDKILDACNYCIVLSNNIEAKEQWLNYAKKHNLKPIAVLDSKLSGKDEYRGVIEDEAIDGTLTNLIRGENKENSEVLDILINNINKLVEPLNKKRVGYKYLEDPNVIDMYQIAKEIDMTNPNIYWDESRANEIYEKISEKLKGKDEVKFFDGRARWIDGLSTEAAKDANIEKISFYDANDQEFKYSNKFEKDEKLEKIYLDENLYLIRQDDEEKLNIIMCENDKSCFLDFELNRNIHVDIQDIESLKLPNIDESKKLYISGKMPSWLLSSISLSYNNKDKYMCMPGKNKDMNDFIKFASDNKSELGKAEKIEGIEDYSLLIKKYNDYQKDNKERYEQERKEQEIRELLKEYEGSNIYSDVVDIVRQRYDEETVDRILGKDKKSKSIEIKIKE